MDIIRGRGVVTALNLRTPSLDDPNYPWHACAQRNLEAVRFPLSDTLQHVQIRLAIR
jgi:hypothetical protein